MWIARDGLAPAKAFHGGNMDNRCHRHGARERGTSLHCMRVATGRLTEAVRKTCAVRETATRDKQKHHDNITDR
jgi:hypothetical protein